MKKIFGYLPIILFVLLLTSCSDKSLKQAQLIPKESSVVIVFDEAAIKEKLKTGNYDVDSIIYKLIKKIDTTKGEKLLENWKNAGIDMNNKFVMFVYEDKKNTNPLNNTANFSFALTDAKKFENFLKSQKDLKTTEVIKGKNHSYIKIDDELVISWNDNTALLTAYSNSVTSKFSPMTSQYREETRENDKLLKLIDKFYNLKESDRITSIKAFNVMMEKKADAYMFTSMNSLTNRLSSLPIQILKLDELLAKNYTVGYINFENGKIDVKATTFYNDKLSSLLKQYENENVKLSLIENFPAINANAAMLLSFKPELIEGLLKELQLDAFVESGLASSKMNVTTKEIVKCLSGNFALAMGDFSNPMTDVPTEKPNEFKTNTSTAKTKIMFNAEVRDFASLSKILKSEVSKNFFKDSNGVFTINSANNTMFPMYVRIDNKSVVVTESEDTYKAFAAKTTKASFSKSFVGNLSDKNSAMYININSMISTFSGLMKGNEGAKKILEASLNTFDEMVVTSDHIIDGKQNGDGFIKLKNDKENSLVSMANLVKLMINESEKMFKVGAIPSQGLSQEQIDSTLKAIEKY
jgi:hypothetical protein